MPKSTVAPASKKSPLKPWMFIPGTLFWILIAVGFAIDDMTVVGGAVALAMATVVVALVIKGVESSSDQARRKAVWAEGRPARAVVKSLQTQGSFNDHPRVAFRLEVHPEAGDPYEVENVTLISQLAVPRIQPEMDIDARIDPADRQFVVLDESLTPYGYARG